jgi:hypothetical protein
MIDGGLMDDQDHDLEAKPSRNNHFPVQIFPKSQGLVFGLGLLALSESQVALRAKRGLHTLLQGWLGLARRTSSDDAAEAQGGGG